MQCVLVVVLQLHKARKTPIHYVLRDSSYKENSLKNADFVENLAEFLRHPNNLHKLIKLNRIITNRCFSN